MESTPTETESLEPESDQPTSQIGSLFLQGAWLRACAPFVTSMAVHGLLFLVLAAWVLPILTHGVEVPSIDAAFQPDTDDRSAELNTSFDVSAERSADQKLLQTAVQAAAVRIPPRNSEAVSVPRPMEPRILSPSVPGLIRMSEEEMTAELPVVMSAMPMHQHRGTTRVKQVRDTAGVAGNLQGDLTSIARDGDALVVWMMDQSISMQIDRQALAFQLSETLGEIEADKRTNMQHYVVAFGDKVGVVQNATDRSKRVTDAIAGLPVDPSGIENTFQSVEWCIDNLFRAKRWFFGKPRQKLLVIWTDESGDDYLHLERVIQRCLQNDIRVDVIGPSAVLGAQTGYSAWRHPGNGVVYYLPVHRGPDSSFPQKLSLGYWYRGVPSSYNESFRGPYQGTSPRWHGGSNLEAMLCGFSPYALTRLSRETGGRYVIYDRPGDQPPFTLEQVEEYAPDYRSLAEIQFHMRRQPLRQLVLAASAITWTSPWTRRTEPLMTFRPSGGGEQPRQFRTMTLPRRLREPVTVAFRTAWDVERALAIFGNAAAAPSFKPSQEYRRAEADDEADPNADDANPVRSKTAKDDEDEKEVPRLEDINTEVDESLLEQLYKNEPSKRWRAWCDLNMGRLLAMSVRLREYLTVTDNLLRNSGKLGASTNFVQLVPQIELQGGAISKTRLKIARRLLQRCIDENRGTPWAVMAERELRDEFGLRVTERFIPTPPPRPPGRPAGPAPPKPVLPKL